jgi:DNA-binding GntR family transcriptional regulator
MTVLEATARQGKADLAYAQLRRDIEEGVLAPGQVLSEIELVKYTGASRTPVREAVRRLAAEGLIDLEPRRAPTVSRISLRSARALFDFRRILEPAAIRLVATRAGGEASVHTAFVDLRDRFVRMRGQEVDADYAAQFTRITAEFDRLLASYTPNEYLSRSITDLRPHSARLRHIAHSDNTRLDDSVEEHIEMCTRIVDADAEGAAEAIATHLHHVDQAIFRRLLDADSDLLL